ncbi:phosphomannomutase/phosphoglucomutase [Candidatus Woesearchaeota archaeon]|nr:phosphomannomutase/phosphoglucomutase [Candidatus Woesearchaeota archaeon]
MRNIAGIYKTYDIRGVVDKDLNEELAYAIGRAFAIVTKAKGKTLLVGHDMRPTSTPYTAQVIKGLTDEGVNVIDAGLVSTPLFYFAARKYDAGIMITASHNPPEYNGFKFMKEGMPFSFATGIDKMEKLIADGLPKPAGGDTRVEEHDFLDEFLTWSLSFLKTTKPHTVVIDAGNGMGGFTYSKMVPMLKEKGITIKQLYFELDGTFPNHEANPLNLETLKELKKVVKETEGVTLGLALDGDGDRCVFIDEHGEHFTSDLAFGLVAKELLKNEDKATVIQDLRFSRSVKELVEERGGTVVLSPVGYANIKPMAKERNAVIGGEISGHFFPRDTGYNENTMYMLFQVLNLIEETGKTLSELVKPLQKYAFSGEINNKVADADATLVKIEEKYASLPDADVMRIDGIRIEFPTWWFSVRKSNTEPVVRLIVEADTQSEMETKRDELLALVRS